MRKCGARLGAHEVRVHASRLGGRDRLDALRVFSTGRSQGLLVKLERALARKKLTDPSDEDREWTEGEPVRVFASPLKVSRAWSVGFGLQVLNTIEGVLGLMPI
jgi:hypothetical protein